MTDTGDELIALSRVKGVGLRLGLAMLAACLATLLHLTIWPTVWLAAYAVAQGCDWLLFKQALAQRHISGQFKQSWPLIPCLIINVLIFSSLSVYNWCLGGVEGKIFASITICCSLISVTLTMYPKKRYLYASLVPHALYLISLPIISIATHTTTEAGPTMIVMIGIFVYLIYLMVAVKKLNGNMVALSVAGADAETARRAAEDANAAKSNFLAVITHEIRTPMNAVVSAVNLLRKTRLNDEQKEHLSLLSNASEVLLGLLNDVLDLSKIEAGKMSVERAPIDLADMLHNLEALFWPQAQQKGLTFKTVIDSDVAAQIVCDPLRLRQILFNLVSNAVKFTDTGAIRLRVKTSRDVADIPCLSIEVQDDGIGIAPEDMERIFSSFEQAEAATTRRYGGTGLGLAISRRLARLIGGDISVRSVVGKGSCFTLQLPYEAAKMAPAAAETPVAHEAETVTAEAPLHVLIVDDHEVNRRIVSLFIEPMGCAWTMAENGAEAIERCHSRTFDVILMDMQMPGIDGIAATRQIRAERGPNQTTPIIALTANAMDYHKKAWAEVGVEDFLTKPIDPDVLIATLQDKAGKQVESMDTEKVSAL